MTAQRILILGGGFGGVYAAQRLEKLFAGDPAIEIILLSDENFLLFTPMLRPGSFRDPNPSGNWRGPG